MRTWTSIRALPFLLLALSLLLPGALQGQGWIEPERPLGVPFGVERLRTHVEVRVVDRVAHVEVEEWFRNNGRGLAEGVYLYPLPGEAVFSGYSLFQGDLELTGETLDRERARAIYEEIVRRRMDPALIELVGHGLVRARVFPIGPGETRRITLRYTQVLARAGDVLELRYQAGRAGRVEAPIPRGPGIPMPIRPGLPEPIGPGLPVPVPPSLPPSPAGQTTLPPAPDSQPASLSFTVTVEDGDRFLDPYSPTHELRVSREQGRIVVRPAQELAGSFLLLLPPAGEPVRLALLGHRPSSEDGYFMLTLSPGEVAASAMPRDLTVVADVSGSMSGEKMEQTRRALAQLLGSLGPQDRFRLISFSSAVTVQRPGWTPAREGELREARAWVESLRAQGGTNISGALEEAFREESPEGRLPVIVFLTDGLPTVGETNAEAIADRADRLRGRSRVFAFGVGYDVDTYLLDRLTTAGRGSVQYVAPGEDVEQALGLLATRIRHPVLTDLALAALPVRVREVFPVELPDLFAGEELTLFGRYAGSGSGGVAVSGMREGRTARFETRADFPEHALENDFIPRLWAARKIGELTRAVRLNGPDPELVDEIRETALRYGILSEYTAHLVLEPGMVVAGRGQPGAVPPMPLNEALRSGAAAVQSAAGAARRREVSSSADVAAAEVAALAAERARMPGAATGEAVRVVAGRGFRLEEDVWVDRTHAADARTVEVEAFSRAYFDLLAALPELRAWWSALSPVVVAGREVSLKVGESGAARLSDAEVQRLVREFRGAR